MQKKSKRDKTVFDPIKNFSFPFFLFLSFLSIIFFQFPKIIDAATSEYSEAEIATFGTAEEMEAFKLSQGEKQIRARELSELILKKNPRSIPALIVLARAMHYGEGNLPKADFLIKKARTLFEKNAGEFPKERKDQYWYWYLLDEHKEIAREMDLREEELAVTRHFDQFFGGFSPSQIFPLIKLNRLDEAKKAIQTALKDENRETRERGMNGLCWLEGELKHREIHYEVCKRACEASTSEVLCSNAGGAAIADFRFEEAERLYLKATERFVDSYHSPWMELSMVYLLEGRISETINALKKAQKQRMSRPSYTDQQDQGSMEGAVGVLLIAIGEAVEAEKILKQVYESPDRAGTINASNDELQLEGAFLFWTALFSKLEYQKEIESFEPWYQKMISPLKRIPIELQLWVLKQHLITLFSKQENLQDTIRPYIMGIDSWLVGELTEMIPLGILNEAIRESRKIDLRPESSAYFDALQAEIELKMGNEKKALELARKAIQNLPKAEKLLQARTAAIGGEAAERLKDYPGREEFWNLTLENFPALFRLLRLKIPVEIFSDENPLSKELAEKLKNSPRFKEEKNGFKIRINQTATQVEICFYRSYQSLHHCTNQKITKNPNLVSETLEKFHHQLMSPNLDLSQTDIHSLGGSPAAGRAREKVNEIIEKTKNESLPNDVIKIE